MLSAVKRFFVLLLITLLAVLFIDFAIVNRQFVTVSLSPLPFEAGMPLFLLLILTLALGVFLGGLAVHLGGLKHRMKFNAEHKRVMALENEVSALQTQVRETPPVLSIQ